MRTPGEGTIFERTYTRRDGTTYKRFMARIRIAGPHGGSRKVEGPSRSTREEARQDLLDMTAKRDLGTLATTKDRLATYLDQWLADKSADLRPRTISTYQSVLKHHVKPLIGRVKLKDLSPMHVRRMVTTLKTTRSVATARKARTVLHSALEDAVRYELVHRNAASVVPAPAAPRHEPAIWTTPQAAAFLAACQRASHGILYQVILGTGLRAGEALGLTWEHVAPDAINVVQQIQTTGAPVFAPLKTDRSRRVIRITRDLADLLAVQSDRVDALKATAREWSEHDLVFPARNGRPLRLENVRRDFTRTLKRAAEIRERETGGDDTVPACRIHDLRHYHLTRLKALGVDVDSMSRRAGHSRTSTTMDMYVHEDDRTLDRASVSIARLIGLE